MNGRKAYRLMPIMLLALFGAPSVQAEQCWSSGPYALVPSGYQSYQRLDVGSLNTGINGFIYLLVNCSSPASNNSQATPFGPNLSLRPTACVRKADPNSILLAQWADTAKRISGGTSHGCEFKCGDKTCRVNGADGLPVELMSFSVDDEETGE